MKKVVALILSLVYFVAIGGVAMNFHYCCGVVDHMEFSYVGASATAKTNCGVQSSYAGKNCCKDVHKQLKIDKAQQDAPNIAVPAVYCFLAILPDYPVLNPVRAEGVHLTNCYFANGPPLQYGIATYLRNCSLLI